MSSDARVWFRDGRWYGNHDGDCGWDAVEDEAGITYTHENWELSALLAEIEECLVGHGLRWEPHRWKDGVQGLRGWQT